MTKQSTAQRSRTQVRKMVDYTLEQAHAARKPRPGLLAGGRATLSLPRAASVVRLRLDPEIADWFASRKEDPHAGINAVLRAYIERRRADGQERA